MKRALTIFLALSLTAIAQDPTEPGKHSIDLAMEKAIDKNPSTAGMVESFAAAAKEWDRELNKHYQTLMKGLDPDAKKALRESQRAWIAHRDKEIDYLAEFYSKMEGTMYRAIYAESTMSIVRRRAIKLGHMAEMLKLRSKD